MEKEDENRNSIFFLVSGRGKGKEKFFPVQEVCVQSRAAEDEEVLCTGDGNHESVKGVFLLTPPGGARTPFHYGVCTEYL
jgi:hypothetical protein